MRRRGKVIGTPEWEQDIYHHLRDHGRVEGEILAEYQRVAEDDGISPAFQYLTRMILDDEVRHHRIFDELAETFRHIVENDGDAPAIPSLQGLNGDRQRIERLTEALIKTERDDERELKDLAKRLKGFDKVTLWGLLIELMLDDTRKHIKILEFIRDRAKDQPD